MAHDRPDITPEPYCNPQQKLLQSKIRHFLGLVMDENIKVIVRYRFGYNRGL